MQRKKETITPKITKIDVEERDEISKGYKRWQRKYISDRCVHPSWHVVTINIFMTNETYH
jgi:hypothetical protein